jgi:uncharacterized membrane protein HdeD (DUF308 family)
MTRFSRLSMRAGRECVLSSPKLLFVAMPAQTPQDPACLSSYYHFPCVQSTTPSFTMSAAPYAKHHDDIQVAQPVPVPQVLPDDPDSYYHRRTCLHNTSLLLNMATIGASIMLAVGQIWGMFVVNVPFLEHVVRLYLIGWCLLIVLIELQWTSFVRNSTVLSHWIPRGLLYTFLGVVSTLLSDIGNDNYYKNRMNRYAGYNNESITIYFPSHELAVETYVVCASVSIFVLGCVYILLGVFCLERAAKKQQQDYSERSGRQGSLVDEGARGCGIWA